MKQKVTRKHIYIIFIISFILIYCYNNFFTMNMVAGKYVHKNFGSSLIQSTPVTADTLVLHSDRKFMSTEWGNGTYKLSRNIGGTKININYKDEYGDWGISSQLSRSGFIGSVKLMIDYDRDEHYLKTEDIDD